MSDMLSQAEIDALLGDGSNSEDAPAEAASTTDTASDQLRVLSSEEKDVLGEIGNISMGTAATTLFTLLNQRVNITTPQVSIIDWKTLSESYDRPCVGLLVGYKEGLKGTNFLILKQQDVKIISNIMMGGDGDVEGNDINELDLSAIAEAMNQMVGSAATSLSSMMQRKVDILSPSAFILDFDDDTAISNTGFSQDDRLVCISFKMEIGTLIDSNIMQIIPIDFAIEMVDIMKKGIDLNEDKDEVFNLDSLEEQPAVQPPPMDELPDLTEALQPEADSMLPYSEPQTQQPQMQQQMPYVPSTPRMQESVNVQPVQFQNFDVNAVAQQKENIEIIMDVPLEVTVELGRTHKLIKEILEFGPGTVVELDKIAGEPIDVLVNGKFVAKGEVVVIDENFGIRITDIVSPEHRI